MWGRGPAQRKQSLKKKKVVEGTLDVFTCKDILYTWILFSKIYNLQSSLP